VLLSGVQGITDLITTPGLINLDFADVKSVMQGAGSALMGIGSARGEDRAVQAAETAISSPLLEASVDGAHGVLLSIQGGSDLGLFEINEAARLVQEAAHPEANIIFGAVIDDALGDEVRVTVIAAGFDGGAPTRRRDERALGQVSGRASSSGDSAGSVGYAPAASSMGQLAGAPLAPPSQSPAPQPVTASARPQPLDADPMTDPTPTPRVGTPTVAAPVHSPMPSASGAQPTAQQVPTSPTPPAPDPAPSATEAARSVDLSADRAVRTPARPMVLDDDLDVPDFLK